MDASTVSSMLASPLPPCFQDIYIVCQRCLWGIIIIIISSSSISIIILLLDSFSHQRLLIAFHRNLSDSKFPLVSRTLFSILADLNHTVAWMVSTRPIISKSSPPCINPLVTIPRAPIIIGNSITFIFRSFFNSLARLIYYHQIFAIKNVN